MLYAARFIPTDHSFNFHLHLFECYHHTIILKSSPDR